MKTLKIHTGTTKAWNWAINGGSVHGWRQS